MGEILALGFSAGNKNVIHSVGMILKKAFDTERFHFFEMPEYNVIFNLIITLLNFWVNFIV